MLIQAALNGARAKAEHPAVPRTPSELARAAVDAVSAGAGALHFHPRGMDGRESLTPADVAAALGAVRAAVRGVHLSISTGAGIMGDAALRLATIGRWAALPDVAAVDFGDPDAVTLARLLRSRGIGVEAGLATREGAERFVDSGFGAHCLRVVLEPREAEVTAALATVGQLETLLTRAAVRLPRLLHGTGATAWPLLSAAASRGYAIRMGLEDTLTLPDGGVAPDNAALIRAACALVAREPGR